MFREHFAHVAECVDIEAPCLDRGSVRQQRIWTDLLHLPAKYDEDWGQETK